MEKTNKQKNQKASKTIYISVINEKLEEFFSLVSVSTYYLHLQTSEVFTLASRQSLWSRIFPAINWCIHLLRKKSLQHHSPEKSPWHWMRKQGWCWHQPSVGVLNVVEASFLQGHLFYFFLDKVDRNWWSFLLLLLPFIFSDALIRTFNSSSLQGKTNL